MSDGSVGMRALVTGASSGLGVEFARQLAVDGVSLVLTARRAERLEALATELRDRHGVAVDCIPCDLAEPDAPERLYRAALQGGRVQILVNNAGFGQYGKLTSSSVDVARSMVALNITAVVDLTHRFVSHMLERPQQRGYVLNVASVAGYQPVPGFAVYAATKAFVQDFSEALSCELRRTSVSVTQLSPGATRTEFMKVAGMRDVQGLMERIAFEDAEPVVRRGLRAMFKGRPSVVSGWLNAITAFLGRVSPRALSARAAQRIMHRKP